MSFHSRKKAVEDDHIDSWLMTYADMITLLLCFFALFLAVSVPEKDMFEKARKQVVEKFSGQGLLDHSIPREDKEEVDKIRPLGSKLLPGLQSMINMYQLQREIKISEDERFITIDMQSGPMFASGSAELSEEGKWLLAEVASNLKGDELKGYSISVEGHTDDTPIKTAQFPSNWELSAARASTVLRFFLESKIPAKRLRAAGYADTFPKSPNLDGKGKPIEANRTQNRRVVIRLEKIESE